jgi:site-specific DNA-cytosine methylase
MSKLTYIDLFCGAGALGEGFSRLNYKHIYSVDNADYAIQTAKIRKAYWHLNIKKQRNLFYKYLHENSVSYNWASFEKYNPELYDQIESTFSTEDLSQDSIPGHIKKINLSLKKQGLKYVDVIIGGPPCQAYSLVGRSRYRSQDKKINAERIKQNLSDNRHHLYQVYLSLVSIIKPKIFVYENVPGLITAKSNKGRIIQLIKNDFENLDPAYKIIGINHEIVDQIDLFGELPNFKNYIINCADFGVPQKRKRVIMIGIRNDHYGKVKNRVDKFFKSIEIMKVDDKINVRDAISDLPPLYSKDKILLENKCETIYWNTGHSHIKRKVNIEKALAGFEKSGHFFFNQPLGYGYDDGINSAIQICHLLSNQSKKMNEIINELPKTYQTPTMAPFCKDEEKYQVVEDLIKKVEKIKSDNVKIDGQIITEILTVNGIRFSFADGSWGLIRASSNKPSLVVVTESPTSNDRKKKIFDFIDNLLIKTGKIGEYDQKI